MNSAIRRRRLPPIQAGPRAHSQPPACVLPYLRLVPQQRPITSTQVQKMKLRVHTLKREFVALDKVSHADS